MEASTIAQRVSEARAQEAAETNIAAVAVQSRKRCATSNRSPLQLSGIRASVQLGGSNQTTASYNKPLVATTQRLRLCVPAAGALRCRHNGGVKRH